MSLFYINIGVKHFIDPNWFLHIMPPYLMFIGLELVYISGFFEILLGVMLVFKKYRKIAAYGIILLLVAVYPANIYLAFNQEAQELIGISAFKASWLRLPFSLFLLQLLIFNLKLNNNGSTRTAQARYTKRPFRGNSI